jgi:RNA polymerase sigma-70 factor (ECF subfamily)
MTEVHVDIDELFRAQRRRLFSIAYRMLGSVSEAEDVVQEAFARYQRLDRDAINSPPAFLTTMVTRIAIDELRSARAQREQYVGEWLPEPLVGDDADPHEVADSLSMAFLVLLESLTPVERAVFLLHEVFDYRYGEIAPIVERTEEHCRQIAHRARRGWTPGGRGSSRRPPRARSWRGASSPPARRATPNRCSRCSPRTA